MDAEPDVVSCVESDALVEWLLRTFPEFDRQVAAERSYWGERPPIHVLFGSVFNPELERAVLDRAVNADWVRRLLAFVEAMLRSGNATARNVAEVTVVERLGGNEQLFAAVRALMGSATRDAYRRLNAEWKWRCDHDD